MMMMIRTSIILILLAGVSLGEKLRGLETVKDIKPIPCNKGTSGMNCVCPGGCLTYYNSTGGCHPNNCWKWSENKLQCEVAGKNYEGALVLQAVPMTGVFGSGFGNIGRWDIFGTYMIVMFGGCCLVCMSSAAGAYFTRGGSVKDQEIYTKCCLNIWGCIWSCAILVLYVWGIVAMANQSVYGAWTDWQGDAILCPLIS